MKKFLKLSSLALALCMSAGSVAALAACGDNGGGGGGGNGDVTGTFDYETELLSEMADPSRDYNGNLFFVNSLEFGVADPSVIYISEGEEAGYFYAYGTSDEIGGHGFQAWRSKDLAHWEAMGVAMFPDFSKAWATDNYWAPEVLYDAAAKKYYLVYNAWNQNEWLTTESRLCLSVAESDQPYGPFVTPNRENMDGDPISPSRPVFDLHADPSDERISSVNTRIPEKYRNMGFDCALDAHFFIDPATQQKYVFFGWYGLRGVGQGDSDGTHLFGMEMKDWYTPNYETLTELTAPGYSSLDVYYAQKGTPDVPDEKNVNEGPFVYYHDGIYYLTYSVCGYQDVDYRVIQATASSPLGKYTKVDEDDGGKVISTSVDWSHFASAGHHCFIEAGDDLFIAYHTFKNRQSYEPDHRALALDKVVWTENSAGLTVMHTNGPTWSLQPLPEAISGYKNIAPSASVTVNGKDSAADADIGLLTDGIVKYQEFDLAEEYESEEEKNEIVFKWDNAKTARAILVYNSWNYETTFASVDKIEVDYLKGNGDMGTVTMNNVAYDWDWCFEDEAEFIRPGGSAMVEFNEMPVKEVRITVSMPGDADAVAIPEIVILGKDAATAGVTSFTEYSFENNECGSPHIINESRTFGDVVVNGKKSTYITTMYGYDLSHDDGTADAYITQSGARDQFAFFKDIFSTTLYAKATFTVPADRGFANDAYPKFGMVLRCETTNLLGDAVHNSIIYYVDAANNYTKETVGCAQRKTDDSDWLWGQDETLQDVPGIRYKNGGTVTLEIIRKGATFYFFCNGQLKITKSDFLIFEADVESAVGFFSFNTPMKITNYEATQDSAAVDAKLAALQSA